MKKGRHRRFEEARSLKRAAEGTEPLGLGHGRDDEGCAECGARPGRPHAEWCLAESDELEGEGPDEGQPGAQAQASGD